jgi:uncharacterized protein
VRRLLAAAAVLTAFAAGCGGGDKPAESKRPPQRLTIATGGRGGIYYAYGEALAKSISRHLPGYRASAQESTGSVENLLRLRDGRADIALTLADTALDAVEGREAFTKPVPLRALAQIYRSYVQVVTEKGSPIRSIADLKGRRVSVGSPDSGTEIVAQRVLAAAHLSARRDIRRRRLGVAESAKALEDGSIDAFFWSGGLPTAAVTAMATPVARIKLVQLGDLVAPRHALGPEMAYYRQAVMPADAYPAAQGGRPVATIAVANLLVTTDRADPGLVQRLTRAVIDSRDSIGAKVHAAQLVDLRTAVFTDPLPLHAGAVRYYRSVKP